MALANDISGGERVEVAPSGYKLLKYRVVSLNTNNAAVILGGACKVYGWELQNTNAAIRYVKLYDKLLAPAPASDVPALTLGVPASGLRNAEKVIGIPFALGLGIALVTGVADNDNTAVAAGDLIVHIFYS